MTTGASDSELMTSLTTSIPATEQPPEAVGLVVVSQMTLLVLISVAGTFANALVFAVFYRRPSLRTISNRFVLSLVLANLMSALVTIPAHVCNLLPEHNWPTGLKGSTYWDQTLSGLTVLITLASVLSILLISLDRYYAVNSPLHYTIIVTRQKSVAMIALVWLVSVILSSPVWTGCVTLDNQLVEKVADGGLTISSGDDAMHTPALIADGGATSPLSGSDATEPAGDETETLDDGVSSQRRVINLSYTISLLFFGFLSPLAALCWLYLRMYEAALKNSARTGTRRPSLCSNAAAETGALTLTADPSNANQNADGHSLSLSKNHQPSLAEALTAAATAAAAAAAASADPRSTPIRISRLAHDQANRGSWSLGFDRCCIRLRLNGLQQQLLTVFWREEGRALRTTAMVISSFLCCWLPFFLSLLPLQQEHHWIFAARLTAFANVLVSPAIYVYRNKVAQREAGRLLVGLFCRCPVKSRQRAAAAAAANSNAPSYQATPVPMLHAVHLRPNHLSHQSSLSSGSSDADTPRQRRSADERVDQSGDASFKPLVVVNWRKEGSVKCQVVDQRSVPATADSSTERKHSRASIAGDFAFPSGGDSKSANVPMRQRSLTVSGDVVPHSAAVRRSKDPRPHHSRTMAQETIPIIPAPEIQFRAMRCQSQSQWCRCTGGHPRRTSSEELKMLNYQTYPSLDFFDIGLEDYGRRAASFSRFVQNHSTPMAAAVPAASTLSVANGAQRKRRTSSFSKVLLSRHKQSKSSQQQPKCSASSMPSVQETKSSFVTAV